MQNDHNKAIAIALSSENTNSYQTLRLNTALSSSHSILCFTADQSHIYFPVSPPSNITPPPLASLPAPIASPPRCPSFFIPAKADHRSHGNKQDLVIF
jgi:hypothetical protein